MNYYYNRNYKHFKNVFNTNKVLLIFILILTLNNGILMKYLFVIKEFICIM